MGTLITSPRFAPFGITSTSLMPVGVAARSQPTTELTVTSRALVGVATRPAPEGITFPIAGVTNTVTATRSPQFTLGEAPIENDILVAFNSVVTNAATADPSGWVNVLGAGVEIIVAGGLMTGAMAYHRVTAAEAAASTVTWTLTSYWNSLETGRISVAVLRGVALSGELVGSGSINNDVAVDGLIANCTPTADSVIIAGFAQEGTNGAGAPTGYTDIAGDSTSQHNYIYRRTANATSGVAIGTAAANTPVNDQYISIVAAFKAV